MQLGATNEKKEDSAFPGGTYLILEHPKVDSSKIEYHWQNGKIALKNNRFTVSQPSIYGHQKRKNTLNLFSLLTIEAKGSNKF